MPATSQLDWLISITAITVLSGSRRVRHRLRSFNFCMGRSIDSHQRRWIQHPRRYPIASLLAGLSPAGMAASVAALAHAMLHQSHDQRHAGSGGGTGNSLDHSVFNGSGFSQGACRGDHGRGERLQKQAAKRAAHRAGNGMADEAETVLLGGSRGSMAPENAGDDLNHEIGRGPRYLEPVFAPEAKFPQ